MKDRPFGEEVTSAEVRSAENMVADTSQHSFPVDSFYMSRYGWKPALWDLCCILPYHIMSVLLLRGCYLIMFRSEINELRGILTAFAMRYYFGLMLSAYGNAVFRSVPNTAIYNLWTFFVMYLINGAHIDQLLTPTKNETTNY